MCVPSPWLNTLSNHSRSNVVTYFRIIDPYLVATRIDNPHQAIVERTRAALRQAVGAHALHSVVTERKALSIELLEVVGNSARSWGIAAEEVSIENIKLPRGLWS